MTALSASPFRTKLFNAPSWTPELRAEAAQYLYDNMVDYGVRRLYIQALSQTVPSEPVLKRELIEAIVDGTTPGIFMAHLVVLNARGMDHPLGSRIATSCERKWKPRLRNLVHYS